MFRSVTTYGGRAAKVSDSVVVKQGGLFAGTVDSISADGTALSIVNSGGYSFGALTFVPVSEESGYAEMPANSWTWPLA